MERSWQLFVSHTNTAANAQLAQLPVEHTDELYDFVHVELNTTLARTIECEQRFCQRSLTLAQCGVCVRSLIELCNNVRLRCFVRAERTTAASYRRKSLIKIDDALLC